MTGIVLMISNYFHDLAVALLASNILVVYFVGRHLDQHPIQDEIVTSLFKKLAKITYWALAYVLVAGGIRSYFFMDFEWNPAVGRGQVPALVVKHIVLFAVVIFGVVAHRRYQLRYGRT